VISQNNDFCSSFKNELSKLFE
ncbi:TPA: multidrug MFS transporter, partial [Streptococcus agalactiae]|nr:multidrug MFS transporter [Streptococcus agalactiae]